MPLLTPSCTLGPSTQSHNHPLVPLHMGSEREEKGEERREERGKKRGERGEA